MFRIKDAKIISKNQNTYLLDVKLCKRKGYNYFEYIENSTYLKRNDKTLKQKSRLFKGINLWIF